MDRSPRFLVIRRDNIGDLVCVTPLFRALRERFPAARICALVNSYNRAVVENNPDIDAVFSYTKAKHRAAGQTLLGVYLDRLRLIRNLRRQHFDFAILAAPGFQARSLRLARMIRPGSIIGFVETEDQRGNLEQALPYGTPAGLHEVEDVFRLLQALGIDTVPPAAAVFPPPEEAGRVRRGLAESGIEGGMTVGIHISARKPSQRWPVERFVALARELRDTQDARFMLFWSPGDDSNPLHPGDDAKARAILQALAEIPIVAHPTRELGELIAGLSVCDAVICSDGGAMHLAAGLGKPILCLFGQSDAVRWHPWGVPHELLQTESREVTDIGVAEAVKGFGRLVERISLPAECRR